VIRQAEEEDYDAIYGIFTKLPTVVESVYNDCDESALVRNYGRARAHGFAKIVEHKGEVVGCMIATLSRNPWGMICAYDLVSYSTRETPGLIREYVKWARGNGVKDKNIFMSNSFGSKRYDKMIQKMGFVQDTVVYRKGE